MMDEIDDKADKVDAGRKAGLAVSYTHLTLPTNSRV